MMAQYKMLQMSFERLRYTNIKWLKVAGITTLLCWGIFFTSLVRVYQKLSNITTAVWKLISLTKKTTWFLTIAFYFQCSSFSTQYSQTNNILTSLHFQYNTISLTLENKHLSQQWLTYLKWIFFQWAISSNSETRKVPGG